MSCYSDTTLREKLATDDPGAFKGHSGESRRSKTKLRIKIAELHGWKHDQYWIRPDGKQFAMGEESLPDYLNDLNACKDFSSIADVIGYQAALMEVVFGLPCTGWPDMHAGERQAMIDATAEQRCLAFVAAMEA